MVLLLLPEFPIDEDVKDPEFKAAVEPEYNRFQEIISDIKSAGEEEKAKLIEEKIKLSKKIMTNLVDKVAKTSSLPKDLKEEIIKIVSDAFDNMNKDPTNIESNFKIWTEAEAKISKLEGNKIIELLRYPLDKLYDGWVSVCDYFTTDEGKIKKLLLEEKTKIMNDPNATAADKIKAQKDYVQNFKEISPELEKSYEKGESKYGETLFKFMLELAAIGGAVLGILASIAHALNGCYQYKIGKDKLKICDDFYHDKNNHKYCDCGPVMPAPCDDTNLYPFCHCSEVKNQVCNSTPGSNDQLYYSYDDSHSAWSLIGDAAVGVFNLIKDLPDEFKSLWNWFTKYGWIVLIVLVVIIALPFIIEAVNTTKQIFHTIHPDGTTTKHDSHMGRSKK